MTTSTTAKQRNHTVDILRLVAAFCIICLHNFSWSGFVGSEEVVALCRFAVPFFFVVSGYFAAHFDTRRKLRQLLRLVVWAVLANLAYLAIDLSHQNNAYVMMMRMRQIFDVPNVWRNFLVFNESPISAHLWFLGGLAYCLILDLIFSGLFKKLHRGVQWAVTGVLLIGGLALYHVLTLNPDVDYQLCYYRSFLLFGLPFFLAGKLLRDSGFAKRPLPAPLYPVLILVCSGLTLLEFYLAGQWEIYLSSILMVFLLMHLALCHPLTEAPKPVAALAWLGKNTTLAIYIIHIYFLDLFRGIYWDKIVWRDDLQQHFGVFHLIPLGVFLCSLAVGTLTAFVNIGCHKGLAKLKRNHT